MFKNDIKINYGAIHTLIYRLNRYKTALEDMKTAIHSIESIFNKGKGEAMETFGIKSEELIKKIDGVEKEISDISGILQRYVTDMTAIIKPVSMDKMMRVDRNDIYWNMQTINGTCMGIPMIPMNVGVSSFGDWFDWDEDEEERDRRRRNDDKLDEIKRMFRNTAKQVSDMADNLNKLYKKVQNYEDMDDKYEKEAKKLKKEYTSFWEGVGDVINEVADIVVSFGKGLFDGIKDFLVGLVELVGGTLKYVGSAAVCLYGEVSGKDVPNWAEECYNETNETVLGVLKDPTILVEGLAQGVSDSFEEKGGAYCGGYAVGTVASAIAGSKGMDKLRGLGKGAGAAGTVDAVEMGAEKSSVLNEVREVAGKSGTRTISSVDRTKINAWDYTPSDELYSKYKEVFDNPKYYNQKTGSINWPKNDGFESTPIDEVLQPGTRIDRYGSDFGSFTSPEGIPYEMRAVAPGTKLKPYSVFEVVEPINVKAGKIAPWFDEPGGGIQYLLPDTVDELLDAGVLRRIK